MNYDNCKIVDIVTLGGYTEEQILANKNCSKDPKYWYRIKDSEKFLFKSKVAESWEFFYPLVENHIGNTNQIYLKFLDTRAFRKEAIQFEKTGYYTNAPVNLPQYEKYWDKQERLCDEGLVVDGVRLSGRYYFTLNFGRLKARIKEKNKPERRIWTFLSFLDHQYYLANEFEECHLEGMYSDLDMYLKYFPASIDKDFFNLKKEGLVLTKGRRKGWSYFLDNMTFAYNFTFIESSKNILSAYEKSKYSVILTGIHETLNFLNKNTAFGRRRSVLNKRDNFRASFKYTDEFGIEIEDGYKSEIECISFKDNPFKAVGDGVTFLNVEEAGIFPDLLETYSVSIEPLIRDGEIILGVPIVGGTAGDMEGNSSTGLKEMIYNPNNYGFKGYDNIYEETERPGKVGWFIKDTWYSPNRVSKEKFLSLCSDKDFISFVEEKYGDIINPVDEEGNSHHIIAEVLLRSKRELRKKGDSKAYQKFITQQPIYLSEAFLTNENSPFDTVLAKEVLAHLKSDKSSPAEPGEFTIDSNGNVIWRSDFNKQPILEFPNKSDSLDGCWVIYEEKVKDAPRMRYIAGCDPIDFGYDEVGTNNKHSLAATYIIDTFTKNIVAEYVGRTNVAEAYYDQLLRGIEYYSATLLYENNLKGLFSHFRNKNKEWLLADEPTCLKDRFGYKSNNRVKGFHATASINSWGRELINKWTLEEVLIGYNEDNTPKTIPRMWKIQSPALLQEIIAWESKGNYDRISGLGATLLMLIELEKYIDTIKTESKTRHNEKFFTRINKFKRKKLNGI